MNSIQILSSIYGLGLGCAVWSKEELIKWCDLVIETNDIPPYEIIEASLMSNANIYDIEAKLFELRGSSEEVLEVNLLLSIISQKVRLKQLSYVEANKCIARLLLQTGLNWEAEYCNLYGFDDSFDLVNDGFFLLNDIIDGFIEELSYFDKYLNEFKLIYFNAVQREWN
ncbi:protein kinase [Bacillus sp. AFS088145]|uniref:protein kinase n=1 Tax=Bacillus sp. AFS088145 TaxID=2033514 RepID=UPI000BF75C90|nr:protein kinase [Bacillus sp. AFS088145]PFH82641.1 protein kinase [Bacillus sp. AFS088145]